MGHDLAVDAGLADASGDQLRVLRAEVDDEHRALRRLGLFGHRWFSVGIAWVRVEWAAPRVQLGVFARLAGTT